VEGEVEGEAEGEVEGFDPVNSPDVSSIRSATSRNWFRVIPLGLSGCLLLPPSLLSSEVPAMRHCLWRCVRMYMCGCMYADVYVRMYVCGCVCVCGGVCVEVCVCRGLCVEVCVAMHLRVFVHISTRVLIHASQSL
jgi:hypothetical protein